MINTKKVDKIKYQFDGANISFCTYNRETAVHEDEWNLTLFPRKGNHFTEPESKLDSLDDETWKKIERIRDLINELFPAE